ncbi:hypothetical protein, partial [Massilia sp. TWR1-2-2]|uniref:hypothetical protein n=1 Tax=Massilia sp. TWR1-2-2 TaxID=2804584 RepID=UPI003CE96C88
DVPFNWVGATSPATFRLQPNKSSVGNPEAAVAVCETFRLGACGSSPATVPSNYMTLPATFEQIIRLAIGLAMIVLPVYCTLKLIDFKEGRYVFLPLALRWLHYWN